MDICMAYTKPLQTRIEFSLKNMQKLIYILIHVISMLYYKFISIYRVMIQVVGSEILYENECWLPTLTFHTMNTKTSISFLNKIVKSVG